MTPHSRTPPHRIPSSAAVDSARLPTCGPRPGIRTARTPGEFPDRGALPGKRRSRAGCVFIVGKGNVTPIWWPVNWLGRRSSPVLPPAASGQRRGPLTRREPGRASGKTLCAPHHLVEGRVMRSCRFRAGFGPPLSGAKGAPGGTDGLSPSDLTPFWPSSGDVGPLRTGPERGRILRAERLVSLPGGARRGRSGRPPTNRAQSSQAFFRRTTVEPLGV